MILKFQTVCVYACLIAACMPVAGASGMGVAAEGVIIPGDGVIRVAPAGMGAVAELRVKTGDEVSAGQVLAVLQDHAAAAAAVAVAQARTQAVHAREATLLARQATAEAELKAAAAGHAEVLQARGQALAKHTSGGRLIDRKIEAMDKVLEEKSPPRREREEIEFEITLLKIERDAHDEGLSALRASLDAQAATADARRAVAQTHLQEAEAARADWQAEIAVAEAEYARAAAALDLSTLQAPLAGTVLAIHARAGEVIGPEGLLWLGDLSQLYVDAEVYVDDLRRIQPGQAVRIEGPALPKSLDGSIERIGAIVSPSNLSHRDPTLLSDRQVVTVRVRLHDASGIPVHTQVTVRIPAHAE